MASVLGTNNYVIYDGADSAITIKRIEAANTMLSCFQYLSTIKNPNKFYNTSLAAFD